MKIRKVALALASVCALSGCGGGGGSSDTSAPTGPSTGGRETYQFSVHYPEEIVKLLSKNINVQGSISLDNGDSGSLVNAANKSVGTASLSTTSSGLQNVNVVVESTKGSQVFPLVRATLSVNLNAEERKHSINQSQLRNLVDSDGDSFSNAREVLFGSDPDSATSVPLETSANVTVLLAQDFRGLNGAKAKVTLDGEVREIDLNGSQLRYPILIEGINGGSQTLALEVYTVHANDRLTLAQYTRDHSLIAGQRNEIALSDVDGVRLLDDDNDGVSNAREIVCRHRPVAQ